MRGRTQAEQFAVAVGHAQRHFFARLAARQVLFAQRRAGLGQPGGKATGEVALVEFAPALCRHPVQGAGQLRLAEHLAGPGHAPVWHEDLSEAIPA
ncbi:hypothetical protein D3C87_1839630 [compost metagenome]